MKKFWGIMLVVWFVVLGFAAPIIKGRFGEGMIVQIALVAIGMLGIILIVSKHDE